MRTLLLAILLASSTAHAAPKASTLAQAKAELSVAKAHVQAAKARDKQAKQATKRATKIAALKAKLAKLESPEAPLTDAGSAEDRCNAAKRPGESWEDACARLHISVDTDPSTY